MYSPEVWSVKHPKMGNKGDDTVLVLPCRESVDLGAEETGVAHGQVPGKPKSFRCEPSSHPDDSGGVDGGTLTRRPTKPRTKDIGGR